MIFITGVILVRMERRIQKGVPAIIRHFFFRRVHGKCSATITRHQMCYLGSQETGLFAPIKVFFLPLRAVFSVGCGPSRPSHANFRVGGRSVKALIFQIQCRQRSVEASNCGFLAYQYTSFSVGSGRSRGQTAVSWVMIDAYKCTVRHVEKSYPFVLLRLLFQVFRVFKMCGGGGPVRKYYCRHDPTVFFFEVCFTRNVERSSKQCKKNAHTSALASTVNFIPLSTPNAVFSPCLKSVSVLRRGGARVSLGVQEAEEGGGWLIREGRGSTLIHSLIFARSCFSPPPTFFLFFLLPSVWFRDLKLVEERER